eukprot:gene17240-biopygen3366
MRGPDPPSLPTANRLLRALRGQPTPSQRQDQASILSLRQCGSAFQRPKQPVGVYGIFEILGALQGLRATQVLDAVALRQPLQEHQVVRAEMSGIGYTSRAHAADHRPFGEEGVGSAEVRRAAERPPQRRAPRGGAGGTEEVRRVGAPERVPKCIHA